MPKTRLVRPKLIRNPKSSPECRRLIWAAVKQAGSWRGAAILLKVPTHAQLQRMLEGRIRNTRAMKAALRRADRRAAKAWRYVKADAAKIDCAELLDLAREIEAFSRKLNALIKDCRERIAKTS